MRRSMTRLLLSMMAVLTLATSFSQMGCYVEEVHRGRDGRVYRHERWREEHVYQHEDGRWYANRNGNWVVVDDVDIR
jgi:hypothetical protein